MDAPLGSHLGRASLQAAGTATAPAAGSAFAGTLSAGATPAGWYTMTVGLTVTGSADSSRPDNVRVLNGAVGLLDLPTPPLNTYITGGMPRIYIDGVNTVRLVVLSNASVGAAYTGGFQLTPIN